MRTWTGPSARERQAILDRTRTVAIVGASANPARSSYFVATYLLSTTPLRGLLRQPAARPRSSASRSTRAGRAAGARPTSSTCSAGRQRHPGVLDERVAVGADALAAARALERGRAARRRVEAGLTVVMDRCIKIEHARFHGGLHLAGFDTGVISSRRRTP